jgi:Ni2+-binding GTPase involved in maturation of urease and hydrogenase
MSAPRARFIMVGGFLGAGKSTAVLRLARRLLDAGRRVGVITNDQSVGLVDTQLMETNGLNVEEVPCGCFCCNFDNLVEATRALTEEQAPEYFLAEPVGSCTDLVATVSYPLRALYGDRLDVAPLSVVLDPYRAAALAGLLARGEFPPAVRYVFEKQLEEADLLVVNKVDMLRGGPKGRDLEPRLVEWLAARHPGRRVLAVSARTGEGMDDWAAALEGPAAPSRALGEIDYALYAAGEAELGWLNARLAGRAAPAADPNAVLEGLAGYLARAIAAGGGQVAHLKITLKGPGAGARVGLINVVNNQQAPDLSMPLWEPVGEAALIVNIRAVAPAGAMVEYLARAADAVGASTGMTLTVEHVEHFHPRAPTPKWRSPGPEALERWAPAAE